MLFVATPNDERRTTAGAVERWSGRAAERWTWSSRPGPYATTTSDVRFVSEGIPYFKKEA